MNWQTIVLRNREVWTDAIADVPHAIAHTHRYQSAMNGTTDAEVFLFVYETANGKAVCPLALRDKDGSRDVYTPYGFSGFTGRGDLSGLPAAFEDFGRRRGLVASYALLHPLLTPTAVGWPTQLRAASPVYVMPVSVDPDVNLRRATPKRQERVRRWRRRWARIEDDDRRLREAFVRMYPAHANRVGASASYRFDTQTLRALVDHPDVFLLGARDEQGEVVSVAMFGTTGDCAEYLFLVQTESGQRHSEGLLIAAFTEIARAGHRWIHLGGGIQPYDGVAAFKRRFGAHVVSGACLEHVFDEDRYAELCRTADTDPARPYFPAYHAPARVIQEAA